MQLYVTDIFVIVANIPISILETEQELGLFDHSCHIFVDSLRNIFLV